MHRERRDDWAIRKCATTIRGFNGVSIQQLDRHVSSDSLRASRSIACPAFQWPSYFFQVLDALSALPLIRQTKVSSWLATRPFVIQLAATRATTTWLVAHEPVASLTLEPIPPQFHRVAGHLHHRRDTTHGQLGRQEQHDPAASDEALWCRTRADPRLETCSVCGTDLKTTRESGHRETRAKIGGLRLFVDVGNP